MLKRYAYREMQTLWSEENRYKTWLKVELAVLEARFKLRELPREGFEAIRYHARINVARINELDNLYRHDMIAFIESVQESLETAGVGKWKNEFHKKLTSYNVEDPAMVLLLRSATNAIIFVLHGLHSALRDKAVEHRNTIMIARTHGQYAEPTSFGHLLMVFEFGIKRSIERLHHVGRDELNQGNISGAVGVYGELDPKVEAKALEILELRPAQAETQILQRDRHAALLSAIAIAGGTIEQIARTFWEMMRSDVCELREPRAPEQRGSSAMAHKRNPILTERLMGMARLLRGYAHAAMENIATPECRDISQSSVERHIFPDATSLLDYMVRKMTELVEGLVVFSHCMLENLENSQGVWASQRVRNALMDAGIPYSEAYQYVQQLSFEAEKDRMHLKTLLTLRPLNGRYVTDILPSEKIEECFDVNAYIQKGIEHIFSQ